MSQVHNPRLHTVQSISIVSAAFIANHVQRGTKEGLIFAAVVGTLVSHVSKRWAAQDETAKQSFFRITTCLTATTILIYSLSQRILKERANILPFDLLVLCVIETSIAMIFAAISHHIALCSQKATKNKSKKLLQYKEDCTEQIERLYKRGSPVTSLCQVPFKSNIFQQWRHNFSSMKERELLWHVEVIDNGAQYSEEELFALNSALACLGLPMNWGAGISLELMAYANQNSRYQDLVMNYFRNNPVAYWRLQKYGLNTLNLTWLSEKDIPKYDLIQHIDRKQASLLSRSDFEFVWNQALWQEFSMSQQITLSIASHQKFTCPFELKQCDEWTEEMLKQCISDEESTTWFNAYLQDDLLCNAMLTHEHRERANRQFSMHDLPEIKHPIDMLNEYKPVKHRYTDTHFLNYPISQWYTFFEGDRHAWESLSTNKRTIFINYFIYNSVGQLVQGKLSLPFNEINTQILVRPLIAEIKYFDNTQLQWLSNFPKDFTTQHAAGYDRRKSLLAHLSPDLTSCFGNGSPDDDVSSLEDEEDSDFCEDALDPDPGLLLDSTSAQSDRALP